MNYLIVYLLSVNLIAFIAYGIDKLKARRSCWRIPEATLIGLASIGGSVGAWMGMKIWHHKTKHKKFRYGIPAILLIHIVLAILIYTNL